MKTYYCWKCQANMPFLEEEEWNQISPLLTDAVQSIKDYRAEHNCDIATARENCKPEATRNFFEITGADDVHFEVIYHHRLKDWGKECKECGYLLRTPQASFCANCGCKESRNS